jgi:hypothetical protein
MVCRECEATELSQLNTEASDCQPVVDSQGQFLIFNSTRPGGFGSSDLYISFQSDSGEWSDPVNMGSAINSPLYEGGPYLSWDDKTLYFCRSNGDVESDIYFVEMAPLLKELKSALQEQGSKHEDLDRLAASESCACSRSSNP